MTPTPHRPGPVVTVSTGPHKGLHRLTLGPRGRASTPPEAMTLNTAQACAAAEALLKSVPDAARAAVLRRCGPPSH
ncbi:hypothetical protein ACFZBU_39395 [Embleya sp. NPDC008237]|uniref:hypothetical protein n=1 Tax=Embleya sp. NPDC008237 TaxID=3363978 RepID=UPI0036E7A5A8